MPVQRAFNVSDGIIAGERMPNEPDELYATPAELGALYGVRVSEEQIRACMSLIHAYTNRPSLWPIEIDFPTMRLPSDRMEGRIPITPVIRILEAAGRYAYGFRRDRQSINQLYYGIAAVLALQGVAPRLVPINVDLIQVDAATGIFSLPYSSMLIPYTEVKIRAIVGLLEIPPRIKLVLAELANSMQSRGVSDRIAYTVGRVSRKYAPGSNTFISPQAQQLLQPFVVQALY